MRPYLVSPIAPAPRGPRPPRWRSLALAALVGALGVLLALPALADTGDLDPVAVFGRGLVQSIVFVAALTEVARRFVPWLSDGSERAKLLTQAVALGLGVVAGLLGLTPTVDPLGVAHPLVAQAAGGIVVASLTSFFRDGGKRTLRAAGVVASKGGAS